MPSETSAASAPDAGNIIQLLRTTQQHHVMLSSMADQKASFLIGASVVTLTLVLGQWSASQMSVPQAILGLGALVSAVFAALALTPRTRAVKADSTSFNPLFCGHFTAVSEEAHEKLMCEIITADEKIYKALMRDIYQMGRVLQRKKFFYLGLGYKAFVLTLVTTLAAAVVTWVRARW